MQILQEQSKNMSKNSSWLHLNLGKYWLIQILIIASLVIYSLFATVSIFILANETSNINPNNSSSENSIIIVFIFESKVAEKPITWDSAVIEVKNNSDLFSVMNNSFQIGGSSFGSQGFLIEEINSLKNDLFNFWTFYYFELGNGWIYSASGVSNFILHHDFQFKWVFGPASS
jgi:hypothetical protein